MSFSLRILAPGFKAIHQLWDSLPSCKLTHTALITTLIKVNRSQFPNEVNSLKDTRNLQILFVLVPTLALSALPAQADVPSSPLSQPAPLGNTWGPSSSWIDQLLDGNIDALLSTLLPLPEFSVPPVPAPDASPCMITPLTAIEDPEALAFETGQMVDTTSLAPKASRALNRFEAIVTKVGETFPLRSAYRPPAYQEHLIQVWDKWMFEARNNTEPSCSGVRAEIWTEFQRHQLMETQRPATSSDHTRGWAFDAAVQLPFTAHWRRKRATLDLLASAAGLFRPVPNTDWVHYRVISR